MVGLDLGKLEVRGALISGWRSGRVQPWFLSGESLVLQDRLDSAAIHYGDEDLHFPTAPTAFENVESERLFQKFGPTLLTQIDGFWPLFFLDFRNDLVPDV